MEDDEENNSVKRYRCEECNKKLSINHHQYADKICKECKEKMRLRREHHMESGRQYGSMENEN